MEAVGSVMARLPSSLRPARRKRSAAWLMAVGVGLAGCLVAGTAHADEPQPSRELGATAFGTPRLAWNAAPPLRLQPEGARLMLELPPEWMPEPDYGRLGRAFDPNKHWEIHRAVTTRWTLGTQVHLHVTDPAHSIDFGLSLMPRAAFAVLRFDPIARWH